MNNIKDLVVYYLSPSLFPSTDANSVHVFQMCRSLAKLTKRVELYAMGRNGQSTDLGQLENSYGKIEHKDKVRCHFSIYSKMGRVLLITLKFVFDDVWRSLIARQEERIYVSRNLYCSLYLIITGRKNKLIHECHHLEIDFVKSKILKFLIVNSKKIVVISEGLKQDLLASFKNNLAVLTPKIAVQHDAAQAGRIFLQNKQSQNNTEIHVAYFGKLYEGRGLSLLQGIASRIPNLKLHVYGDIKSISDKKSDVPLNVIFHGFVNNKEVFSIMQSMDLLLLPYQRMVKIGFGERALDTSRWMSPMKLFEYMSSSTPIICSDLPVLKEVLEDERNALLCNPEDFDEWVDKINKVMSNRLLYDSVRSQAFHDYEHYYTWEKRVQNILSSY